MKKLQTGIALLILIFTIFSSVNFAFQSASASPPTTGDRAFANASVSYRTIDNTGNEASTQVSLNAVGNATASSIPVTSLSLQDPTGWTSIPSFPSYTVNGTLFLAFGVGISGYNNKEITINDVWVNISVNGVQYSDNTGASRGGTNQASVSGTASYLIAKYADITSLQANVWVEWTEQALANGHISFMQVGGNSNFDWGWNFRGLTSKSSTFALHSNDVSYSIHWSSPYDSNATYNSLSQNAQTAGTYTGSLSVMTISFVPCGSGDYPNYWNNVSYWLNENYSSLASAEYPTLPWTYTLTQYGNFFNSSTVYFNYSVPSGASSSFGASYSLKISNLTLTNPSAPIDSLSLNSQNFSYYSLIRYKSTYNVTAYKNYSSAQNAYIKFSTSETVNYYPSITYAVLDYSGHGSTQTLVINASDSGGGYAFDGEKFQVMNVNWGDGSPVQSSPIESSGTDYYNFTLTHQYNATGTFTVTLLVADEPGTSMALASQANGTARIKISTTFTSNALPVKTNTRIYMNYTQLNVNVQTVNLYINNILVQTNNTASNTNSAGTVSYDIPYYLTQTAEFTATWEWFSGGISGSQSVQYSVVNSVPTVGVWLILNYTIGTGPTATNESVPYFYSQRITYNYSWSYYVWQVFLPNNAVNVSIKGNALWESPVISVPADFYKNISTFFLLVNTTQFQLTWLAPNLMSSSLLVIDYYPQSAVWGLFGVTIPFSDFSTYLNGNRIYSPTQTVNLGSNVVINTTTVYGTLLSSYSFEATQQTQFVEIPLDIVPFTVYNMNSSYVVDMSVSQGGISQSSQVIMPLSQDTFYAPAGTYNFSFAYLPFNSGRAALYYNITKTLSSVSYVVINGVTIAQLGLEVMQTQDNITNLVENVNISLTNANDNIKNQVVNLNLNLSNVNSDIMNQIVALEAQVRDYNSTVYSQLLNVIADIRNDNSTVVNEANSILSEIRNDNSTIYNQTLDIIAHVIDVNSSLYQQTVNILAEIADTNSSVKSEVTNILNTIEIENSTLYNQTLSIITHITDVNSSLYGQTVSILTDIANLNSTVKSQTTNILNLLKADNSTLYNQTVSIIAHITNVNSSLYSQTVRLLTDLSNLNSTVRTQTNDIITSLKSDNSTLYNQTVSIITHITDVNSSLYEQTVNILTDLVNLNSTVKSQTTDILDLLKVDNSILYNQTLSIIAHITDVNSSIYQQTVNILAGLVNLNSTVKSQTNDIITSLKMDNSTLYNQTLSIITHITDTNSTLYRQTVNVLTNLTNLNSTVKTQTAIIIGALRTDNSTLYNQTIKVLADLLSTNSTIYNEELSLFTELANANSSIKNETANIFDAIKIENSTLYNQTLKLLTNLTNFNSTVYSEELQLFTEISNTNSSVKNEIVNILSALKIDNSTLYNQTVKVLTNLTNFNSTVYGEELSLFTEIANTNSSVKNETEDILSLINIDNSTLYNQTLKMVADILNTNSTIYNEELNLLAEIDSTNSSVRNETANILSMINIENSTLYNQTVKVLTDLTDFNSTVYNEELRLFTEIENTNSSVKSEVTNILNTIEIENSTLYNQTLKILANVFSTNSTVYNEELRLFTEIVNTNSTVKNETVSILNTLKIDNSTLYNQTLSILTKMELSNTTLYNQIATVLLNIKNTNASIQNQIARLILNITNTNSTIYRQLLIENTSISNLEDKIVSLTDLVTVVQNNIMSDINVTTLNVTTKETTIKDLVSLSLQEENSTFSYQLKFGTPSVTGTTYQFPVFVSLFNGQMANLSVTQQAWQSLKLYYVAGNQTYPLNFSVANVQSGSFVIWIYNVTPAMAASISSNHALITAQGEVKEGVLTNLAAGIVGSQQIQYSASNVWTEIFGISPPNENNSAVGVLAYLSWLQESYAGRAIYLLVVFAILAYYAIAIDLKLKEKERKKNSKGGGDVKSNAR